MPLYDFACGVCGTVFEELVPATAPDPVCPGCGGAAARLPGVGRGYRADADWIDSVRLTADKTSAAPHVRAFLAHPTRRTYRDWMRGEKIRPLEPGEPRNHSRIREAAREAGREAMARFAARRLGGEQVPAAKPA